MTEPAKPDIRPDWRHERRGAALWIWIDREHRRNALNSAVLAGIETAMRQAEADRSIRCIVLTGAGDKAFCAGADLADGAANLRDESDEPSTEFGRLLRVVRAARVPLIARVNGACVAGGMALMAMCDLAVAAEHARFGLPEVKVGVFPMQVLVLLRGILQARHINELCLTGTLISAARAAEIGLVNEVSPAGELDARIDALVARLHEASPAAVHRGKQAMFAMEMMAFHEALAFAEAQIALAAASSDAREGVAAFNEKRKPRWGE